MQENPIIVLIKRTARKFIKGLNIKNIKGE